MKRLVALVLALSILMTLPIVSLAEDTVLTVGGWPAGDDAFKTIIPQFEADHPGVKVELFFP